MTALAAGPSTPAPRWTTGFRFARRELRGGLHGFRIFLACLALGVAAIAGVGSMSEAVRTGLANDAKAILGGDLTFRLVHRPMTAEERAFIADRGDVSLITDLRAMARVPDGGPRALVQLKAVDAAYPLYGTIATTPAAPLPELLAETDGTFGAAVAPSLLERLQIEIGDRVEIGEATVTVRAVIDREPDRGAAGPGFALGPRVMISHDALPDTELEQPGSLIYNVYRVAVPEGAAVAPLIAAANDSFPDAGWRVRTLNDATPQLSFLIGRTTLFLTLVGLSALLVGGIGVANAVRAYLEGKTAVIATYKCLGATSTTVFTVYLTQILVLAGLGILIGLVLGALTPLATADLIAAFVPVEVPFRIFPLPLALAAVFGVLTALVFSIWPVARACGVPAASLFRAAASPVTGRPPWSYAVATLVLGAALAALAVFTASDRLFAAWFVAGAVIALLAFRAAASLVIVAARRARAWRRPTLRMAMTNLQRPGTPTPSVVLSLGLGLTVLVAVALIENNLGREISEEIPAEAPAFFFIDIQPDQVDPFTDLITASPGVTTAQQVPMLRGRITGIAGVPATEAVVAPDSQWTLRGDRGVTWAVDAPDNSPVVAGEWWPADYAGPQLISFDAETAAGYGVGIGDTLTVNVLGREIQGTIANLRHIEWGTLGINFLMIFSPGVLEAAPRTHIATVYAEPEAEGALERDVTDRFANVSAVRVRDALDTIRELVGTIGGAVRATASLTVFTGALVLAGAIAAGHRRRVYDAVVLKVLGATRRDILAVFLLEYGILGLITALIAALIGSIAAWSVVTWVMDITWRFSPAVVAYTAIGSTLLTLALGFIGTWRVLGQKAAPLLRNE